MDGNCPPLEEVVTVVFIREWLEVDRVLVCVLSTLPLRVLPPKGDRGQAPSTPSSVAVHPLPNKVWEGELAQSTYVTYGHLPPAYRRQAREGRSSETHPPLTQSNSLTLFNKSCTELISNRLKAKSFLPKSLSEAPK